MNHAEARAGLLRRAAEDENVSNRTLKRSLDLLAYFDIEELELDSIAIDEWGAVLFTFAAQGLPQIAVSELDVTAYSDDEADPVARLMNAVTCAYEADDVEPADDEAES